MTQENDPIEKRLSELLNRLEDKNENYLRETFSGRMNALSLTDRKESGSGYNEEEKNIVLDLAEIYFNRVDQTARALESLSPENKPRIDISGPQGNHKSTTAFLFAADASNTRIPDELWQRVMLQEVRQILFSASPFLYLNSDRGFLADVYARLLDAHRKLPEEYPHDLAFYKKYAESSRFLRSIVGAYATQKGVPLIVDSTMGSPAALEEPLKSKQKGQPLHIVLLGAPDEVRLESMKARAARGYVQSDLLVTEGQRKKFDDNLPLIFKTYDTIYLAYTSAVDSAPVVAAKIDNKARMLTVYNKADLKKFYEIYPVCVNLLGSCLLDDYQRAFIEEPFSARKTFGGYFDKLNGVRQAFAHDAASFDLKK
jgi:hypothetical protein